MRVVLLTLPFVLSLLVSCEHLPQDVLDQQRMEAVLVDVHKLEAYLRAAKMGRYGNEARIEQLYEFVFQEHGITKDVFEKSVAYYSTHYEEGERIYNKVQERLESYKVEVEFGKYHNLTQEEQGGDTMCICHTPDTTWLVEDMWEGKRMYRLPLEGSMRELVFRVNKNRLKQGERFLLRFCARLYEDDKSKNPECVMIVSQREGKRDTLSVPLVKNGEWESYELEYEVEDWSRIQYVSGKLFQHDPDSTGAKHAIFWDIAFESLTKKEEEKEEQQQEEAA